MLTSISASKYYLKVKLTTKVNKTLFAIKIEISPKECFQHFLQNLSLALLLILSFTLDSFFTSFNLDFIDIGSQFNYAIDLTNWNFWRILLNLLCIYLRYIYIINVTCTEHPYRVGKCRVESQILIFKMLSSLGLSSHTISQATFNFTLSGFVFCLGPSIITSTSHSTSVCTDMSFPLQSNSRSKQADFYFPLCLPLTFLFLPKTKRSF